MELSTPCQAARWITVGLVEIVSAPFFSTLKGKSCQPFNSDVALKIILPSQIRFYYPDLQIVCESNDGDEQYQNKPVVIIEVLSESTRRIDLGEKRDTNLSIPTLQVLIITDPSQVFVCIDRRVENNGFLQEQFNDLDHVIDLPEVDTNHPLADIYDGISLD